MHTTYQKKLYRIFLNIFFFKVFKTKMDLIINSRLMLSSQKTYFRYVIVIIMNVIDRIHTKLLGKDKNMFYLFFEKHHLSCHVIP